METVPDASRSETGARPEFIGYAMAVLTSALATWLRLLVEPYLGDQVPFVTFFLAVVITAWVGGFGPTILALILSGLAAAHYFIAPDDSLIPTDASGWVGLTMFAMFGTATAFIAEWMRRKSAQIRRDRERFQVTLASIGDGVIVTDTAGRVTFINAVAERLTGWSQDAAFLQPVTTVFQIVDESSRQPMDNPAIQALQLRRVVGLSNHTILIVKDGSERSVDDSAAPILGANGVIEGSVLVFRDVTKVRASQIAQGRLAAIVDSSEDAIIGQTMNGVITDWNTGAEQLYGFAQDEVLDTRIFDSIVPADRKQELLDVLHQVALGQRVEPFETIRLSRDGREIPVAVRISPIHDHEGVVIGASAIDRDISMRIASEKRRNARMAVSQILFQDKSVDVAIPEVLESLCCALGWDTGCYWTLDTKTEALRCQELWQNDPVTLQSFRNRTLSTQLSIPRGLPGQVWKSREPLWLADVTDDPRFDDDLKTTGQRPQCGLACPVGVGDKLIGVLEFLSCEFQPQDDDLFELMSTIGSQIGQFLERQQAEEKLRRSEQELADFFENAAVGLHWVGPDGTVVRVNQAELDLLGYTREEYIGGHIADFHADEHVIEDILQRLHAGQELHQYEARLRCKDGSIKFVLIDSNVLWDDGRFVHTRCFTRDITERKRMEQSLRFLDNATKSLASLVDYRSTLQKVARLAVPDFADWVAIDMVNNGSIERLAVAHVDPDKVQLAEELHRRYPPDPDSPHGVPRVIQTGESELIAHISDETLAESAQDDEHLRILRELELKSYMGVPLAHPQEVLGVISFVSAESGRIYGPTDLALAEDLAHRATIAIENARLYQEIRDRNRQKDEFLAMLAHELRNPLAPIRSGLDILAMENLDEHVETIELMQEQVTHVVRLVDDLLDVSRIMRGRVDLRKEPVELGSLVNRSVKAVSALIEGQQQTLRVSLPEQEIWLNADPVRIVQVLENLLNNASKYTDVGGEIQVDADCQNGMAVVNVRDNGVGIEPELLPQVFELFTQASRSLDRAQGGLGIGLTLVKRLVEMHDGSVTVHSQGPGHGSCFSVTLPIAELVEPSVDESDELKTIHDRRVLVVDDNVGSTLLLRKLLQKLGNHEVDAAHDGVEALKKINQMRPEIVLLDIGLPGMDGYEVARKIREDQEFDDILIVALTGYGRPEDLERSRQAGFDEHYVKPPSVDQLRKVLSHLKLAKPR